MKSTYIIKKNNQLISFYYGENKSIYMQKLNGNQIYKVKVIENVSDCFSVSLDKKGQIYVFCQDENGNVKLATSLGESFKISNLFQKDFSIPETASFTPLFLGENISLVFNSYAQERRNNYISIKTLLQGKEWTNTENIDIFYVEGSNFFETQKLNDSDLIMVYEKREKDIQLGYKEILNGKISPFITLHRTGYQIVDFSFLAFRGTIHFLYVVKNLFSSQVIYRKKDERGLSNPIVLSEGQKIRDCTVSFSGDSLYCTYMINSSLFYSVSKDFGESFSNSLKHKKTLSQDIVKANFITNTEGKTYLNQVYVDYRNPLNIQFLPEICPEYISSNNSDFSANMQNTASGFISDLSNQNINYINNNKEQEDVEQLHQDNIEISYVDQINNTPRNYRTVMNEGDFMDQFNPQLFEEMLRNQMQHQQSSNFDIRKNNIKASHNIQGSYNAGNMQNFQNMQGGSSIQTTQNSIMPNVQINMQPDLELSDEQNRDFIKNKLEIANEQLEEKSQQLIKLNNIIQEKNKEMINIELELRREIKKLEEENKKLKESSKSKQKTINKEREEENAKKVEETKGNEKK